MIPTCTWRTSALAAALLALTAQGPAPSPAPIPWCTRVPLPGADFSLTSDVDGRNIHRAREPECRSVDVRAGRTTLRLALAATEQQREHGLMNLPFVPAGQGMLFAFPGGDAPRMFWMKDTIAPLDMIFVKADGTISAVFANVPATAPGTADDKLARRDAIGRYVIELGAGDAARVGLAQGMHLAIPTVEAR